MRPLTAPGATTKLAFGEYSESQAAKQAILSDMIYAASYGFAGCRMPTPGVVQSAEDRIARNAQVAAGGRGEKSRQKGSRELDPERDLSPYAAQHYAERLMAYPQTGKPQAVPG